MPRKRRRSLRMLGVGLASLALVGLGAAAGTAAGYSNGYGTASAEASAKPVPTVTATATVTQTVTKTETVTQTPYACTQALQYAEQIIDLSVDTIGALSDTNKALRNGDLASLTTATAHLQSLNTQLDGLGGLKNNYLAAKNQCH